MPDTKRFWLPVLVLACLFGCRGEGRTEGPSSTPPPTATNRELSEHDLRVYLAVRDKAMDRLEESLEDAPLQRDELLARVEDVTAAEREAAQALGVQWADYSWVREELGRLLAEQRQREDGRILALELERSRDDLEAQLAQVRDDASREFLRAQIAAINDRLTRLERDRQVPDSEARALALVEDARADLATLQGRQDRIQRRLRALLQEARAREAAQFTPVPHNTPTP